MAYKTNKGGSKENSSNLISLPEVIGLPPKGSSEVAATKTWNVKMNALIQATVIPCLPHMKDVGLTVFKLRSAFSEGGETIPSYKKNLADLGYSVAPGSSGINFAFMASETFQETLSNEYGESFLNSMTNAISGVSGELAQMTGSGSGGEALKKIISAVGAASGMSGVSDKLIKGGQDAKKAYDAAAKGNKTLTDAGDLIGQLAAGARIDFPSVWKNSSFTPTYSFTCRLWNPHPASDGLHKKYILGPLAAIFLLAVPLVSSKTTSNTYNYPYFSKVKCKGLFNLTSAAISNISLTKGEIGGGGITFGQRLGVVDVTIQFVPLFKTLTLRGDKDRQGLKEYLDILNQTKLVMPIYEKEDYNNQTPAEPQIKNVPLPAQQTPPNQAGTGQPPSDPAVPAPFRVDPALKAKNDEIETAKTAPPGFFKEKTF